MSGSSRVTSPCRRPWSPERTGLGYPCGSESTQGFPLNRVTVPTPCPFRTFSLFSLYSPYADAPQPWVYLFRPTVPGEGEWSLRTCRRSGFRTDRVPTSSRSCPVPRTVPFPSRPLVRVTRSTGGRVSRTPRVLSLPLPRERYRTHCTVSVQYPV